MVRLLMQLLKPGKLINYLGIYSFANQLHGFSRFSFELTHLASHWTASSASRRQRGEETRIESLTPKWQPHWDRLAPHWSNLRTPHQGKAYVLPMFPYPSGTLHLGHLRVYTISDVLSRFKHMQGYKVLHPIGWDAFGLPAENAAIERRVHPEKWTLQNIESMKAQMKVMGGRWDWDCEIQTCDPSFYMHTQRIFLMLYERGLAYQAESLVNYDPIDKTVLANEQVDANGCSWRSGAKVEKLMLKQWFLKIKHFQDPLLNDLDTLAHNGKWPEKVLAMQKNWIGRSEGAKLRFTIDSGTDQMQFDPVHVFTTRADTLFGVQYIALSLSHPIVKQLAPRDASLRTFIKRASNLPPDTKEGYLLSSIVARNPIAGQIGGLESSIPIYVAPYVLDDYGSGAVMGVPGHDTRDHAFWRANARSEPIKVVVASKPGITPPLLVHGSGEDKPMTEKGFIASNIESFSSLSSDKAAQRVVTMLRRVNEGAEVAVNWRLRDWLISRQRYWGTPIPIIHCASCGPVPVPEQNLPVKLPNLPDSFFDGRKGNPLAEDESWKKTECPKCGSAAERETDTMDTFMDSSWYFFRFLDPNNETALVHPRKANEGMQVDLYIGGVEHAILHLLYARFISKFLATTSAWPEGGVVNGEPFKQLITQGMVHGETFTNPENGRILRPDELELTIPSAPRIKANGLAPTVSYEKMSKSKHNGVDPSLTIKKYGADATRAHMLFQAPVGDVLEWDSKKITGVQRWLQRIIRLSTASWIPDDELAHFTIPRTPDKSLVDILKFLVENKNLTLPLSSSIKLSAQQIENNLIALLDPEEKQLWIKTQQTIASVTESYSLTYSLNTVVSDLMTLTNTIWDTPHFSAVTSYLKWHSIAHLVRMVAPIAPGVAEEAWHLLTQASGTPRSSTQSSSLETSTLHTVFSTGFPIADANVVPRLSHTIKCVVQVDGKRKFEVEIEKVPDAHMCDKTEDMTRWILDQLLQTNEGKDWLDEETGKVWKFSKSGKRHSVYKAVPEDWKVIVINRSLSPISYYSPVLYQMPISPVRVPGVKKAEFVPNQATNFSGLITLTVPRSLGRILTHNVRFQSTTIPTVSTCPSPTCECASTPPNLDIDRQTPLLNTMATYSEQVVLCTGKDDWQSNIEQEEGPTGEFVKGLKGVIGKGGSGFDPFYNVIVTASSLPASSTKTATTVLLFPAFKRISNVPHTRDAFHAFATAYLKARTLHPMHDGLSPSQKVNLLRDETVANKIPAAEVITNPVILICGHGGRDQRCGVLGPILHASFQKELERRGIHAHIAQISHIGGHKYAGNVVIYTPSTLLDAEENALRGTGIWYGRVGPENVQGVVEETIVKGRVILDLLRGGITSSGESVGMMLKGQLARDIGEDGGLKLKPRARR
ncbi:hypothetical protein GQ44DRAFT_742587 [Phaeosphaeriaceae sp. PMI808]|nr:hypothetical protein GQ44DRAFT_742587 [Phaeosphaeriaceae sp. PMI808]